MFYFYEDNKYTQRANFYKKKWAVTIQGQKIFFKKIYHMLKLVKKVCLVLCATKLLNCLHFKKFLNN